VSRGRHARTNTLHGRVRRLRTPLILFTCAFAVASSSVAFAFTTATGNGEGQAQAVQLPMPGAGTATYPGRTSLVLIWGAATTLPSKGGYLVLRSTSSSGPYARVPSGSCSQKTTVMSAASSCTDTALTPGTTYYYVVESAYDDGAGTVWVSAPDGQFSGTTTTEGPAAPSTPDPATSVAPTPNKVAPMLTSATSTTFVTNAADSFQVTATGSPTVVFSDVPFYGCKPSILPPGVTFSATGLLSGSPAPTAVGTYTVCLNATNGVAPNATATFTLTIAAGALAITSPAVTGAASVTPNLGPLTVRRQTLAGAPAFGGALTVTLSSAPSVTFGSTQFAASGETTVTIPSGQSSATFWLGSLDPGAYTVTAAAASYVSASQVETVTPSPAGLSVALGAGSTGAPVLTCGPPAAKDNCTVSGVGSSGKAVFSVCFVNVGGAPVVYSATQPSTITETGLSSGTIVLGANMASTSGTVSGAVGTTTLTYGPNALTLTVSP